MGITHATVAVGTDAGTGEVHKAEWNAAHTVTGYQRTPDQIIRSALGAPDTAYDFDTSSLTGLTGLGSPDAEDANTTIPGCYYIKQNATASYRWDGRYQSVTTPFTVVTCIVGANPRTNFTVASLFISVASPGNMDALGWGRATREFDLERVTPTAFGSSIVSDPYDRNDTPVYMAIRGNSSTSFDYATSMDGLIWTPVTTARNPSITVASAGIGIKSENGTYAMAAAFEFFYIYNSAKTLPGF